jgi:hypothetical protein
MEAAPTRNNPVLAWPRSVNPMQLPIAPTNSKPSGEILWTIGPAQKRKMNISVEV